ncbi:MAG: hypothetical protein WA532_02520 [Candidatus Korobacteraceae bacterium]
MRNVWWILALVTIVSVLALSQGKIHKLTVGGYAGNIPVMQTNGKDYVEVTALAQLVNGSLSFHGDQMTLSLTGNEAANSEKKAGLSRDFLRAGIEEMSTIREWHSVLATAIENQFPVTKDLLRPYETSASKNLRIAQVAATTDADQKAAQLVTNEYQKMKQLSDSFLAQRAAATYINADALTNDTLNQSLIACGRSLEAMAASGQFTDDGTCR